VADLVTLCDMLPHLNCGDTAEDLRHADVDNGAHSDVLLVGVDHHDFSGGDCAQEGLAVVWRGLVDFSCYLSKGGPCRLFSRMNRAFVLPRVFPTAKQTH
jgi:hypothetical protein